MLLKALSYGSIFVLAVAAFLATAESGQEAAAFPPGGRGGGFHGGAGFRGGFYGGGFRGGFYGGFHGYYSLGYHHHSYDPHRGYYPYYAYGYVGGYYPSYSPYTFGGYNYDPGYYGSYGTTVPSAYNGSTMSNYGSTSDPNNLYSSSTSMVASPQTSGNNAVVHVHVPLALAEVVFSGHKTTGTGKDRVFTTPELTPGKTYTYTVTATWTEGGLPRSETRMVQVQAGMSSFVDFAKKS
jgi:uncharacterized protein (TIGR03000 family)